VTEPDGGPLQVCAVCSRVLNVYVEPSTGRSVHIHGGIPADHKAIPVDPSELASVEEHCDFCFAMPVPWMFPAEDFQDPHGDWSHGHFGACQSCYELIMAGDDAGLARAGLEGATSRMDILPSHHPDLLILIRALHDGFRAHRTGPPENCKEYS
jgi:hypothetical protein